MRPSALHILFVSSWYPTRSNPTHGIFNRHFAEAVSRFATVSVLHVSTERQRRAIEFVETDEENIRTLHVYAPKVGASRPLKRLRQSLALHVKGYRMLFRDAPPDIIQLNVFVPAGLAALYLSRKFRIPLVANECWSGYTIEDDSYRGLFRKLLTRAVMRSARVVMPTSDYLMRAMKMRGLHGNYRLVPNTVDTARFVPSGSRPSTPLFVHISSLNDREKNVSGILRSFRDALLKRADMELHLVGEGEDRKSFELLSVELGIASSVKFRGRLSGSELVSALSGASALLMFSNYETFSVVNVEALSCGVPVISSTAGAVSEYLTAAEGILVPVGDEHALTAAILSIAAGAERFEPERLRSLVLRRFSYEAVGQQLKQIYSEVLNR